MRAGPRFVDAAYLLGLDFIHDGRASAAFDMDGDGDQDLAVLSHQGLQVLQNDLKGGGWLRLSFEGPRTLGAVVRISAGGREQIAQVALTSGFHTQVAPEVQFGLGPVAQVDWVEVRWPSGAVRRSRALTPGAYRVSEAREQPEPYALPIWAPRQRPRLDADHDLRRRLRDLKGGERPVARLGRKTVLNVWAPWCEACKREIPALAKLHAARQDVQVVGVSVETKDVESVRSFAKAHGLDYPNLLADEGFVRSFFGAEGRMSLPATFLFDAHGRLYKAHHREIRRAEIERTLDRMVLPASAKDYLSLAVHHARGRRLSAAREALQKATELEPGDADAFWRLGMVSAQLRDVKAAKSAFERATRLAPQVADAWLDLAMLHASQGELKRARALLKRASALAPDDLRVRRAAQRLRGPR